MIIERRIKWIDVSKGLTLILVVLGHVLRTGLVRNMVYSFHVPCFFFLSGIVADEELSAKSICKEAKRTLIPYYSFGLISIAIYCGLGTVAASSFNMGTDSIWENICKLVYGFSMLKFNAPLWFLPALFATKILYKLVCKMLNGNSYAMVFIAIAGSIAGFLYTDMELPSLPYSFEIVLKLFPFFLLGKLFAPRMIAIGNMPHCKHKCALFGGMILVATCIISGGFSPPVNYINNSFPSPLVFYIVATMGCMGIYGVSVSIQNINWLSFLGKKSLPVLVIHKFPVVFFQIIGPFSQLLHEPDFLRSFLIAGIPVTAIAIVMSLIAGYFVERYFPSLLGMPKRLIVPIK